MTCQQRIEMLTRDLGNYMVILSEDSQASIAKTRRTIEVCGRWTKGERVQFGGGTLYGAVEKAAKAYEKYLEERQYEHPGGLGGIEIDADLLREQTESDFEKGGSTSEGWKDRFDDTY